ncbi:YibE/F family protein [Candidatus Uhrbacteria bacterium]|nr:YibE/F family protein [Candidatus Uhrbacteria bacterium]
MSKRISIFLAAALVFYGLSLAAPTLAQAGTAPAEVNISDVIAPRFVRAKVTQIVNESERDAGGVKVQTQELRGRLLEGDDGGREVDIENSDDSGAFRRAEVGETLVLAVVSEDPGVRYYVADHYRMPAMLAVLGFFFLLAVALGRRRGFASFVGLMLSILILATVVMPQIAAGYDPLMTAIAGSMLIIALSMFMSHGPGKRTTVAVAATVMSLIASGVLATAFVRMARLFGAGSDAAFYLQYSPISNIDLRGLLLAGIIISTLGVLDDVTTAQVAAVEEIHNADPTLSHRELYKRGLSVGREHIASLVNTLALVYAGASLPLFLVFHNNQTQPLWVMLNGEPIAEEFIRTMVGSCGLILAVPISTWMAAVAYSKKSAERSSN